MQVHYIKTILGIKDEHVRITQIKPEGQYLNIHLHLTQGYIPCPACGCKTSKVHDYRIRKIKHGYINGRVGIIFYKRRRYVCKHCQKRFPEPNVFVDRRAKISRLTKLMIIDESKQNQSFKDIGKRLDISTHTVMRTFDQHTKQKRIKLPEVISLDEFKKSNTGDGKYALSICDPIEKKIIDIMPNRQTKEMIKYFNKISRKERYNVKYVVIDLWSPYKHMIESYFPKAKIIADVFHFTRYIYWAFNDVRIRIMNTYKKETTPYKILKKYWKTLVKSPLKLKDKYWYESSLGTDVSQAMIQDYAANLHSDMEEAMRIKDYFFSHIEDLDGLSGQEFIETFIDMLTHAQTDEFYDIRQTFIHWKTEIINAFDILYNDQRLTNGFIEGTNNFIKVVKRIAYGFRDFDRFRNKVLFLFNKTYQITA